MRHQQRQQHHNRKQKSVQHHMRDAHLPQRNLAEEKSAPPKATSHRTRRKPQRSSLLQNRHTSTLAHSAIAKKRREPKPSPSHCSSLLPIPYTLLPAVTRLGSYSPA